MPKSDYVNEKGYGEKKKKTKYVIKGGRRKIALIKSGKATIRPPTEKEKEAISNLRKIMTSKTGAIKSGTLKGGGTKSTQKEVEKEVPTGYMILVNNKTRKFKRMPQKAFAQGLVNSDLSAKQKEMMLRKAHGKDREVFTANKKILSHFKV